MADKKQQETPPTEDVKTENQPKDSSWKDWVSSEIKKLNSMLQNLETRLKF